MTLLLHQRLVFSVSFISAILICTQLHGIVVLICISLMTSGVELLYTVSHLFEYPLYNHFRKLFSSIFKSWTCISYYPPSSCLGHFIFKNYPKIILIFKSAIVANVDAVKEANKSGHTDSGPGMQLTRRAFCSKRHGDMPRRLCGAIQPLCKSISQKRKNKMQIHHIRVCHTKSPPSFLSILISDENKKQK